MQKQQKEETSPFLHLLCLSFLPLYVYIPPIRSNTYNVTEKVLSTFQHYLRQSYLGVVIPKTEAKNPPAVSMAPKVRLPADHALCQNQEPQFKVVYD